MFLLVAGPKRPPPPPPPVIKEKKPLISWGEPEPKKETTAILSPQPQTVKRQAVKKVSGPATDRRERNDV